MSIHTRAVGIKWNEDEGKKLLPVRKMMMYGSDYSLMLCMKAILLRTVTGIQSRNCNMGSIVINVEKIHENLLLSVAHLCTK